MNAPFRHTLRWNISSNTTRIYDHKEKKKIVVEESMSACLLRGVGFVKLVTEEYNQQDLEVRTRCELVAT